MMSKESAWDLIGQHKGKIEALRAEGINPFPNGFVVSHTVADVLRYVGDIPDKDQAAGEFTLAGRMLAINNFGKAAFIRFRDRTGTLQAYIRQDKLGHATYALFKRLDIGDFVGLCGPLFQTRTGEWTLLAASLELVCKASRPLPEKFHGLKDPEKRYRQRHVDLIMNGDTRQTFIVRSRITQAMRNFFLARDFLEAETPMMQPIAGGAEATPFVTHHKALDMPLFLRIAPELYLKRLVVGGFERVFEINRNFRNEGLSTQHNPEFTMLEFYQAYATYEDLMTLTEQLFADMAMEVLGTTAIDYQGQRIDFTGPWPRLGLTEALERLGGLDPGLLDDRQGLIDFASRKGL